MNEIKKSCDDFHGNPMEIIENTNVRLEYLSFAPRIVRLNLKGFEILFADLLNNNYTGMSYLIPV